MSNHATVFPGFLDLGDGAAVDGFQLEHDPEATAAAFRVVAGEARCPACGRIRLYAGGGVYHCSRCPVAVMEEAEELPPGTFEAIEKMLKPAA